MRRNLSRRDHAGRNWIFGGLILSAFLLAAAVAGCGGEEERAGQEPTAPTTGPNQGKPVKIGFLTAISGPASVYAPSGIQAIELAIEEVNEAGGVLGRKVEVILADDKTDPRSAEQEARRLVQQDVVLALHEGIAANRDAAIPVFERANIPYIFAWSYEGGALAGGSETVCSPLVWSTGQVPDSWVAPPMEYLLTERGWKKWFMIGNDYKFPRTMIDRGKQIIKEHDGVVVGEEYAPLGTSDYAPLIARIQDAGRDVAVFNSLAGGDLIAFFKQYAAAGGDPARNITFAMDEQIYGAVADSAEGVLASADYFFTLATPENERYLEKLEGKFGDEAGISTAVSVQGYEAVHLWAKAVEEAGSFDTAAVSEALPTVSFAGPRGEVQFGDDRFMALPNALGVGEEDGTYRIIKQFPPVAPGPQCPSSS